MAALHSIRAAITCSLLVLSVGPAASMAEVARRSAAPPADADRAVAVAHTIRQHLPRAVFGRGAAFDRLLRERLACDPRWNADDLELAWDPLFESGGRLPLGVTAVTDERLGPDAPARLLDALASAGPALARGTGGLEIALTEVTWSRTVSTRVVEQRASEFVAGRVQQVNPEYLRLQTELAVALQEHASSQAEARRDPGLIAALAEMADGHRVGELRKSLRATEPLRDVEQRQRYLYDVTEARAEGTLSALVTVRDPVTGFSTSAPLRAGCTRVARGLGGVRPDDAFALANRDADAFLPEEREMVALAFDELRRVAAAPVLACAAQACLVRAGYERRAHHDANALGWLLLARDCGATPPRDASAERALAGLARVPYARLHALRLGHTHR